MRLSLKLKLHNGGVYCISFDECMKKSEASKRRLQSDIKPGSIPDKVTVINKIILNPGEYHITINGNPLRGKKENVYTR